MVWPSFSDIPVGEKFSGVVVVEEIHVDWIVGSDFISGTKVAFKHVGKVSEGYMTLYQVVRTNEKFQEAWIVLVDPQLPPLATRLSQTHDYGFAHDVCCGLGGFATAWHHLGCHTVTAVDWSPLAIETFAMNHHAKYICSAIGDMNTVHAMHVAQSQLGVQPVLFAGYPCQPYSKQGHRLSEDDLRSLTLREILVCAYLLRASAVVLECVPAARTDAYVQRTIAEFATQAGYKITQQILDLHHIWPSRRSRCFTVLVPSHVEYCELPNLPAVHPQPSVRDVIPFDNWPIWHPDEESQLRWTEQEQMMFRDARFGNTNRKVDLSQPLPTALHSWGSPLDKCPCGCRPQGFSLQALLSRGLRGVEVTSGAYPYEARHIHPRELQLLLGFLPMQHVNPDCKAQLCLFGNAVSPVQTLWTSVHLLKAVGFLPASTEPAAVLSGFLGIVLQQRDITWPSPLAGVAQLRLKWPEFEEVITFNTSQTIQDLLDAEQTLSLSGHEIAIACEGSVLPSWSFLQERVYEVTLRDISNRSHHKGPVFVWYLGVETWNWVLPSLSNGLLMKWCGILEFTNLVDENGLDLDLAARVRIGGTVVVQQDQDMVALDLDLSTVGFGLPDAVGTGGLRFSDTYSSSGLWQFDQWIRSNSIISWASAGYAPLTIWLPSLAEALVEFWPGTIDDSLQEWTNIPSLNLYAVAWEFWGWNLIKFELDSHTVRVTFFEPQGEVSGTVSRLAARLWQVSGRQKCEESHVVWLHEHAKGSLAGVFSILDQDLGLPSFVVKALAQVRPNWPSEAQQSVSDSCSPTLPWTSASQNPKPLPCSRSPPGGLSAKFLCEFSKALVHHEPLSITAAQIKVLSVTPADHCLLHGETSEFVVTSGPLFLFVLVAGHWTFVHAWVHDSVLHVGLFDGLACTSLSSLAPLIDLLKRAWNPKSVVSSTSWVFPQRYGHTCGSLAIAHFAYHLGLITFGQGFDFELMHDSLAICSNLLGSGGPIGFGNEEQVIRETLEQLLPSKGVPSTELANRIQAAIKTFGTQALTKALKEKQVWPALKQLGSNRPKPFFWVTHHELQLHIQERGQAKFGASLDMKKGRQGKQQRKVTSVAQSIDPLTLQLMPNLFSTNDGTALQQLTMSQVQKDARGIAFTSPSEAQPFLAAGKMISGDGLALLIVGSLPKDLQTAVPLHTMRIPALYKPTNEPIIVDCTVAQLGDQAVYQRNSAQAPTLDVYPTSVFRLHVFLDQWKENHSWDELVARPIKVAGWMF